MSFESLSVAKIFLFFFCLSKSAAEVKYKLLAERDMLEDKDISSMPAAHVEQCPDFCRTTPGCVSFVWAGDTCWAKNAAGPHHPDTIDILSVAGIPIGSAEYGMKFHRYLMGSRLSNHILVTQSVTNEIFCAHKCFHQLYCISFSFQPGTGVCELYKRYHNDSDAILMAAPGAEFWAWFGPT